MTAEARELDIDGVAARTARDNLSLLIRLRWLAIVGQIGAIAVTHYGLGVALPRTEMAPVVGFLIFLNLYTTWRIRTSKPISDVTVVIELLMDVICLTILLFLSGGASNPFVSLFILQVILGIILLPARLALVVLVASVAAHYWLLGNGLPLALPHYPRGGGFFNLHLQGMFLSFTLAACLLFWFVTRIMANLRAGDEQIASLRRQIMEEDHLVRLGLLASGAAHELGTPLTTIAVTLEDWAVIGPPKQAEGHYQLQRVLGEIRRCREIVSDMLFSSGQERLDEVEPASVASFIDEIVDDLKNSLIGLTVANLVMSERDIATDPMLEQALCQILKNAQEAGATAISISAEDLSDGRILIRIADNGPGFPTDILANPGQPFQSHREGAGRGLGLFLAVNALRRIQGEICFQNTQDGGAEACLILPCLNRTPSK